VKKGICLLIGIVFSTLAASPPPSVKLQVVAPALPITFDIDTVEAPGVLVEYSKDLKNWEPSLNIFSKVRFVRVIDRSTAGAVESPRFYRALRDVQSPGEMSNKWRALGLSKYQYKFRKLAFPQFPDGIVTVNDGKVVEVMYPGTGVFVRKQDLSNYKSIEELFDIVIAETARSQVLIVEFDRSLHFPSRIEIDYDLQAVDDEIFIEAGDVQPIP
jgi:hypothetical protein